MRRYEAKQVYRSVCAAHPYGDKNNWRYVLETTEQLDSKLSLILGEVVHNLRTALDHVLVAMRSRKFRYNDGFPLNLADIWAKDDAGEYIERNDNRRASFTRAVEGAKDPAVALITESQPCRFAGEGIDPKQHSFGILGRLDNSDKHRDLALLSGGLSHFVAEVTARGDRLMQEPSPANVPGAGKYLADGAECAHF